MKVKELIEKLQQYQDCYIYINRDLNIEDEFIDLAIYSLTQEQIEKIHKEDKLMPLEPVCMWKSFDLCVGGSKSISL